MDLLWAKLKKLNLCTIFGLCAMLVGCFWFSLWIIPLFRKEDLAELLFSSIFLLSLASPGGFAAYFGFRLIKEKNKQNIKASVGTLAIFSAIFLDVWIEWRLLSNHAGTPFSLLIMTIAAILIYIPVSRFLMIREGLTPKPKGEFVGKGIIQIIAWQIWLAGIQIARVYEPKDLVAMPWNSNDNISLILIFFAPIVVALVFYKVSMKFIPEDKRERTKSGHTVSMN